MKEISLSFGKNVGLPQRTWDPGCSWRPRPWWGGRELWLAGRELWQTVREPPRVREPRVRELRHLWSSCGGLRMGLAMFGAVARRRSARWVPATICGAVARHGMHNLNAAMAHVLLLSPVLSIIVVKVGQTVTILLHEGSSPARPRFCASAPRPSTARLATVREGLA